MIIRDKNNAGALISKVNRSVIGLLIVLFIAVLGIWYFGPFIPDNGTVYYCSAENVRGLHFVTKGHFFEGSKTQSSEKAFKGRYSCKLDTNFLYGMTYRLKDFTPGEAIKASVYRFREGKTPGSIVASGKDFYISEPKAKIRYQSGWELVELYFNIPLHLEQEEISIYVYNPPHGEVIYYDEFRIERLGLQPLGANNTFVPLEVNLDLTDNAFRKLELKREEAYRKGMLISSDEDWVSGRIQNGDDISKVSLRLKGDWLDHLKGDKWSFRVKVKDPHSWNRMKTISFQNPRTRSYLREWVFHQFLLQEDILTPRYDFVSLKLGRKDLGVYAYEEHFEKQIPEYNNRREGPIIRFVEDGFWLTVQREFEIHNKWKFNDQKIKTLNAAEITPFKEGKTSESETLSAQFRIAQSLMEDFRRNTRPVEEIFDIQRLAKYYALVDVNRAYHGLTWINQRMYFNPVTGKLEPVGFDGFGEQKPSYPPGRFIAEIVYAREPGFKDDEAYYHLFYDEAFIEAYLANLYAFSEVAYSEAFLTKNFNGISEREKFIQTEFPNYTFDWEFISEHVRTIRQRFLPYNNVDLIVKSGKKENGQQSLSVTNFHFLPIRVIGFGDSPKDMDVNLENSNLLFPNTYKGVPKYTEINAPASAKVAFFKMPGLDSIFHSTISKWDRPDAETPAQELFSQLRLPKGDAVFMENDSQIVFSAGNHTITSDIIIPEGYTVAFEGGTNMDFINKAKFISRSPVFMGGTEANPIKISSSDGTANGFTVLQANKRSRLRYVHFDKFNTLNDRGWMLTGAVNFYESDVDISYSHFTNNGCEDGLNIIRSDFLLKDAIIANTFSDGFDADFCTGIIQDTYFNNTGNDGMDMSGSVITVIDCIVENAGDKGISVGEHANVEVKFVKVDGAVIGVASKDLSMLNIDTISLVNCQQGIAAYQKKPEFGGGKIEISRYSAENVKFLHRIEQGSELILKDRRIKE
ncbi:MAG: right-handed parallel beta-helix repeat-containing protein [Bacteroidota bacterium]